MLHLKFRTITHLVTRLTGFVFAFFLLIGTLSAQSRAELESAQKQLQEKINLVNKLLNDLENEKHTSLTELSLLSDQIKNRRSLLLSYRDELQRIRRDEQSTTTEIQMLKDEKEQLVMQYGKVVRASYRSSLLQNKWLFLLSSASLNQLYLRWRYLKQINSAWSDQLLEIRKNSDELNDKLQELLQLESNQLAILRKEDQEQAALQNSLEEQQKTVANLEKKEEKLRRELNDHAQARNRLRKTIEEMIRSSKPAKAEEANMPMTPAMVRLSASFEANKGSLPWPVERGIMSRSFGKHRHPTLRNVSIVNNGVDINTERKADVLALFDGTVVGQQHIPGYDYMVIVSHGNYYTVYSYLAEVNVSKGMKVKTSQKIGTARSQDGVGQVHLEVWEGRKLLDPKEWLMTVQ